MQISRSRVTHAFIREMYLIMSTWASTLDFKSGYITIMLIFVRIVGNTLVAHRARVTLSRRYYVFRVLPFRLASACYVSTKLLRPLVKVMG